MYYFPGASHVGSRRAPAVSSQLLRTRLRDASLVGFFFHGLSLTVTGKLILRTRLRDASLVGAVIIIVIIIIIIFNYHCY